MFSSGIICGQAMSSLASSAVVHMYMILAGLLILESVGGREKMHLSEDAQKPLTETAESRA